MWNSRPWLAAVAAFAFVSAGCDNEEPIDARKVADVAATRSAQMLKGVSASMRTTSNLSSLNGLSGALSSLGAGFEGVPVPAFPVGAEGTSLFAPETTDAQADQLARYLRERIFTEANVESSDGNTLLFRLKGSEVCTDGTERPDEGCVQAVDAAELRIRATNLGNDSLELELLIGPNRVEPMSLRFLPKVASFVVDLGGLKGAVAQLASGMEAFRSTARKCPNPSMSRITFCSRMA